MENSRHGEGPDRAAPTHLGAGRRGQADGGRLSLPPQEGQGREADRCGRALRARALEGHVLFSQSSVREVLPEVPYVFTEF